MWRPKGIVNSALIGTIWNQTGTNSSQDSNEDVKENHNLRILSLQIVEVGPTTDETQVIVIATMRGMTAAMSETAESIMIGIVTVIKDETETTLATQGVKTLANLNKIVEIHLLKRSTQGISIHPPRRLKRPRNLGPRAFSSFKNKWRR